MGSQIIMPIRHADKPTGNARGVDEKGKPNQRSLIPKGWARAGIWAELFAPAPGPGVLPRPEALFASAPDAEPPDDNDDKEEIGSKSRRPRQTSDSTCCSSWTDRRPRRRGHCSRSCH